MNIRETIKKNIFGNILAGIIGGTFFLLFIYVVEGNMVLRLSISLGIGILAYVGTILLFANRKTISEYKGYVGISKEFVLQTLRDGRMLISDIVLLHKRLPNLKQVVGIVDKANKIFDHFERNPKNLKMSKPFIFNMLNTTITILEKYYNIYSQGLNTPELKDIMDKAEVALDKIQSGFERQLVKILQDSTVLDLDTELSILEDTMSMERF